MKLKLNAKRSGKQKNQIIYTYSQIVFMKIAYIILAHHYHEQLDRLLSKLNTENISFFIHIDKKADDTIYH